MAIKKESKRQYLARRRRRVRELFRLKGWSPREIAEKLVREGTIETSDESLESALRLVRSDVAAIRTAIDEERAEDSKPALASNDLDALERELAGLRRERDRQEMIAQGQPVEMCARSRFPIAECVSPECLALGKHAPFIGQALGITMTDTPQGMMTTYRPLWPPGARQRASKDRAILVRQISELERAIAERRRATENLVGDGPAGEVSDVFRVIGSAAPTEQLIAENASRDKIN